LNDHRLISGLKIRVVRGRCADLRPAWGKDWLLILRRDFDWSFNQAAAVASIHGGKER
jgi:hypothetical protein